MLASKPKKLTESLIANIKDVCTMINYIHKLIKSCEMVHSLLSNANFCKCLSSGTGSTPNQLFLFFFSKLAVLNVDRI